MGINSSTYSQSDIDTLNQDELKGCLTAVRFVREQYERTMKQPIRGEGKIVALEHKLTRMIEQRQ